jgi:hypothetical protein
MNWPSELTGPEPAAHWFNRLLRKCQRAEIADSADIRPVESSHGTQLFIRPQAGGASTPAASIQQYRITAIFDDYLEARTWDGTTQGSTAIKIAKPWRLRKTGWHGVTITYNFNGTLFPIRYTYLATAGYRTALHTGTNATENQAIIPVYSVNDILYATEPTGGTLVTVAAVALTWLDLNVDARAWARY